MKVYLHIGWHKTGTSAIQSFMGRNRQSILENSGILFSKEGILTRAHHLAAWSLQDPITSPGAKAIGFTDPAEVVFDRIFKEAERAMATALVLSSEEFSSTEKYPVERLARVLKGHEVNLIVYLRRQDEYVESLYNQCVKVYSARIGQPFDNFLRGQIKSNRIDYEAYLADWVSRFPGVSITVRVYDRDQFPENNVVLDFMQAIGLPPSHLYQAGDPEANASLSSSSVKALAQINAEVPLPREEHERLVAILEKAETKESRKQKDFLSPATRVSLLKCFEASNTRMFKRWLGKPNLFQLDKDELEQRKEQWAKIDEAEEGRAVDEKIQLLGARLKVKRMKIIQIGFNKCGTQSLHDFYEMHGFKAIHWDNGKLAARIKKNYLSGARILEGYEHYDFISDMEVTTEKTGLILAYMDYFKEMECQYPDAKFILNTRNMRDWLESRSKHGGPGENNLLKRYMGLFAITREQVFNLWTRLWFEHHYNVVTYFQGKPDKLFIFDLDRPDVEGLAKFSGITNPKSFPHKDLTKASG